MAQQDAFNRKATYQALSARLSRYNALVEDVFDELNKEAAAIATAAGYQGAGKFSWKDYPSTTSRVKKLQQQFIDDIGVVISSATSSEWQRSNAVQDSFVTNVLRSYGAKTDDDRAARYFKPNSDALAAFKKRKERGLGLSDRLWDLSSGYSDEICAAISCAIGKGTSAIELSHELSRYLLNFDELKADYQDLYGDATDIKNCEYRAARLARTEINMAYRSAENERWAQMDFIVGFEVKTTQNGLHQEDVCDTLAGKYPKDFVWTGWHPNCMCYKVPILKTEEEFWAWDGSGEPSADSINAVKDTPGSFRAWVQENKGRVAKAKEAGTLPYFIRDNKKYLTRL